VPYTSESCLDPSFGEAPQIVPGKQLPMWITILAVCVIIVPDDLSIYIGHLRLSFARVMLIIVAPFVAARFLNIASRPRPGFLLTDALVLFAGLWMIFAASMTDGLAQALPNSGADALELVIPYFIGRTFLTDEARLIVLAQELSVLIAAVGILASLDTVTGHYVLHDAAAQVTRDIRAYQYDVRYGVIRAAGTFPHPILLGIACAFGVVLSTVLRGACRIFAVTGGIVGLVTSISSAPAAGLALAAGCFVYRGLTNGFDNRWRLLVAISTPLVLTFAMVADNPWGFLFRHLTFDPGTGYYRLPIWQFAGSVVMDSPLFGVGLTLDWTRPAWMGETVDSLWLRAAMTYGIPGSAMIGLCLLSACSRPVDRRRVSLSATGRRLGLALSLIMSLCVYLGFTVYFWGSVWILMGLFTGMRAMIGVIANSSPDSEWPVEYDHLPQVG
jgi:hypothetical protein